VDAGPERAVLVGFSGLCSSWACGSRRRPWWRSAWPSCCDRLRLRLGARPPPRAPSPSRDRRPAFEDDEVLVRSSSRTTAKGPRSCSSCTTPSVRPWPTARSCSTPVRLLRLRRVHLSLSRDLHAPVGRAHVGPLAVRAADPLGLFAPLRLLPDAVPFDLFTARHPVAGLEELGARRASRPRISPRLAAGERALPRRARHRPRRELRRVLLARHRAPRPLDVQAVRAGPHSLLHAVPRPRPPAPRVAPAASPPSSTWCGRGLPAGHGVPPRRRRAGVRRGRASLFVPPGRGESHLARALDEVIRVKQDGTVPLLDVVDLHRRGCRADPLPPSSPPPCSSDVGAPGRRPWSGCVRVRCWPWWSRSTATRFCPSTSGLGAGRGPRPARGAARDRARARRPAVDSGRRAEPPD
jgi:hypothetical protein